MTSYNKNRLVLTTVPTAQIIPDEVPYKIQQNHTSYAQVCQMNIAFGNPAGSRDDINWERIEKQCKNIKDEYNELMTAIASRDLDAVRDALCDIRVFAYGANHLLGIDADDDMKTVVDAVMTRFIKNDEDKAATIAKHAAKGVTDVYFEGEYPRMVMKSASDQPDAPKGKFLKSASFTEPKFS